MQSWVDKSATDHVNIPWKDFSIHKLLTWKWYQVDMMDDVDSYNSDDIGNI